MKLYFSPLASSMAARIALYEAGADAEFVYVETRTKELEDGSDFWPINPMGQVPALETNDGVIITETAAILQHIADRFPGANLAPLPASPKRAELHQWLNFISSELHQATFLPMLDPKAPQETKDYALVKADLRLARVERHLENQAYLLDDFSVADCYLFAVLNWAPYIGMDFADRPSLKSFLLNAENRPAVGRSIREESILYLAQLERRKAA